ncbi:MAG: hypothetical protein ACOYNL_09330 [Rickettsiales bacterium]
MPKQNTNLWDSAALLPSEDAITAYLQACAEEYGDDPVMMERAQQVAARARGLSSTILSAVAETAEGLQGAGVMPAGMLDEFRALVQRKE